MSSLSSSYFCSSNCCFVFSVYVTGSIDDGDWSTEASCVCTWNVDRRGLKPKQADLVIDAGTAVMAISFHPTRPSLIAGILFLLPLFGLTLAVCAGNV